MVNVSIIRPNNNSQKKVTKVKITDSEIIKSGEKELIDAITGDLDWGVIEKVFKDEHKLGMGDDIEYTAGDIVVHNNEIAYKLEFDVKVKLTVMFNRNGEYLLLSASEDQIQDTEAADENENSESEPENALAEDDSEQLDENSQSEDASMTDTDTPEGPDAEPIESVSQMASEIADMITDINED